MNKKKTINNEVKKSALMRHESVVLDENAASKYKEEIYEDESDNLSDDDDPNTSPKNSNIDVSG